MTDLARSECSSCGQKGLHLKRCQACNSASYCDVKCQKKDWKSHRNDCRKVQQELVESPKAGEGSSCSCEACGNTEVKLLKCGACKSVRYCSTVCQKRDWGNHKKDCSVLKVYPIHENERTINTNISYLTGGVTVHRKKAIENVDMIVKIQTGLQSGLMPGTEVISGLSVYNESKKYYACIPTSDKNHQVINDKILKDGLTCAQVHPLLKKMYVKAHLNPDFSLDVYLNCTHNINSW